MQDGYAGDVGDFGKYGLLRWLCRTDEHAPALQLGVLWYLFDGKDTSPDGGHTQYLDLGCGAGPSPQERLLADCDPDLFKKMRQVVRGGNRSVAAVENSGALPEGTALYNTPLNFDHTARSERSEERRKWLDAGLRCIKDADLVFADPDNGLEIASRGRLSLKGPKYVYYDDLLRCWELGKSLVVYHHLGRKGDAQEQIARRSGELRHRLRGAKPIALRFRRRTSRVYFVLAQPRHASRLTRRIEVFLASSWGGANPPHFDRVGS